jgi:hypothetical protein
MAVEDRLRYDLTLERVRLALLRAAGAVDAERVAADLVGIDEQLARTPPGRAGRLARRLGLEPMDLELLWTIVACAHDPRCRAHALALGESAARAGVSLMLHVVASGLSPSATRHLALRVSGRHPLLRSHVIRVDGAGADRAYHVPDRVAAWLSGDDAIDPELDGVGALLSAGYAALDEGSREIVDTLAALLMRREPGLVVLEGPQGIGKRTLIGVAADAASRPVIVLDAARIPRGDGATERIVAALTREVLLRGDAVALVANLDLASEPTGGRFAALVRCLEQTETIGLVTTTTPGIELGSSITPMRLRVPEPTLATRCELWRRNLETDGLPIEPIATRYRVSAGMIESAARTASLLAGMRGRPVGERDVLEGLRTTIAERLGGLAVRVEPRDTWDDLVLPADTLDQIRALVSRVRHAHVVLDQWGFRSRVARGGGVAALFSGPPGTGKTMVAGIIARELELELYQVDLSQVVSKWVGETEKQLSQIFDAAESGHALLLFDEADALFSKRTEVKAAVDRYANLEVNYLLQRIEAFGGVAILTTNMDTAIDPALKRRLAAHVAFWPPDEDERLALWTRMIPSAAPRSGSFDFDDLVSEFPEMSGANIRNAVVAAAFLAASEGASLGQEHLDRAARAEYRAMGRVLKKGGHE